MPDKPSYEELEQRVKELEKEVLGRKQVDDALRESENHFRTLIEQAGDGVLVNDLDGRFSIANQRACEMLAYTREEILKMSVPDVDPNFSMSDDKKLFWENLSQSNPFTVARTYRRKDGSIFPVEICVASVELSGQTFALTLARDITERKQAEQALTSDIAHEINNILGIILGNTELVLDDVPKWAPVFLNLKEIKTASLRAKEVVRQLLNNIRKVDYKRKPMRLIPVVKDSIKFLRATIPTAIDIRKNIRATADTILADPTQINHVIINLGTHASHTMAETGGILEIDIQNVNLGEESVSIDPDLSPGSYVEVTVSDTGQGMPPEMIDQLFDPFFITKEVGEDTGMKLSVVQGIVKSYGGAIEVESEPGKGTIWHVYFPAVEEEAVIESQTAEALPTGNEKILFIDDEQSIVNMARQMLERLGYQVETKMDPVEALALFRSKPDQFDLVITDMTMPHMTGNKLVKEILYIRQDIPIILCTGYSEKISEEKAKELGIKTFALKPLAKSDFAVTVRKVLDDG
jgi:PAS domain S-box-containing protein